VFWPSMISIANHYSLIATVCVFVALAEAVAWIGRYSGVFNLSRQTFCLGIVCLTIPDMVLSLKDTLSYGGGKQSSLARDFVPKPYAASLRTIVDTIEPSAPVAGPGILLPQLSYRKKVYYSQALWRYYDIKFDYLILDTDPKRIGAVGCDRERYDALVTEISKSDGYELMFRKDGFEVYKRSSRADPGAISNKYTCHRQPHN
jgi:hypothetical protein